MRRGPLAGLLVGLVVGLACTVALDDLLLYTCTAERDCGGDGYRCTAPEGGAGRCCKPTADTTEVCDGKDNDCNGLVDDLKLSEVCDGQDNDCDMQVDEGFNLAEDTGNCGRCGVSCLAGQVCVNGGCVFPAEGSCVDGVDNDMNGKTDCADTSCNARSCGPGCQCQAGRKAEVNCVDGVDNNGNGSADCADPSCGGAGCFDGGCVCLDGGPRETRCFDGEDNNRNGSTDCGDPDCLGQSCLASPQTFRCTASQACRCNGADAGPEETGQRCWDRVDNDCDGLTDCQEAGCATTSCAPDGGLGCQCAGGEAREKTCTDRLDNDFDGFTDCADVSDCPVGTLCTFLTAAGTVDGGVCAADRLCR